MHRLKELSLRAPWTTLALALLISPVSAWSIIGRSVVLVTLLVTLFLRSLKWGLLAMAPNLAPMAVFFGALGWLGYPLDGGVAIVGPVGLGIAVDDTIHPLHVYTRERRRGVDAIAALNTATRHCGRAIAIVAAAILEMLLLPALVVLLARARVPAWVRRLAWSS